MKVLEKEFEGGKYKAVVKYSGSLGLEIKKPKIGSPFCHCPCGEKHKLDDSFLKSAKTAKFAKQEYGTLVRYEKSVEGFSAIATARRLRERQTQPAHDFVEKARNLKIAQQMMRGMDTFSTSRTIYCRCGRRLNFGIVWTHTIPIPETLTFIELSEAYPLKPTKLTLFVLKALSFHQGYNTPHEFLDMVNNLHSDLKKADEELVKAEKTLKASNGFHSKLASDCVISMNRKRLEAAKKLRDDLKKQLSKRLKQIFDSSNKSLPPEEAETEEYP